MPIIHAKLTDISKLTTLYQQLTAEMHTLQPTNYQTTYTPEFFEWQQMITDPLQAIFVHRNKDQQIDAFCHITTAQTSPLPLFIAHRFAYLTTLYVAPAARRHQVASALLIHAKQWQQTQALDYLELTVLGNNTAALALYHKLGYTTQNQTLRSN
ncbi:GNAT family N-acetyltransferase [Latilactobacillus graminis]|uniref:Acetyltransferase family protein n=2 Tax=Latilactobacillus graminis TaxID=60519 RepID=A0AA89HZQ3_9LACO|nr:GNAT family N-acetyltransferase [Latilactobacillus graminis]KRM20975.1 acetyltransferase family protein [Latilactobacillus graminis DSM 20719]QFP79116.1 GNAT family N-acetyltransferase [Latilactobacillus graminis]